MNICSCNVLTAAEGLAECWSLLAKLVGDADGSGYGIFCVKPQT